MNERIIRLQIFDHLKTRQSITREQFLGECSSKKERNAKFKLLNKIFQDLVHEGYLYTASNSRGAAPDDGVPTRWIKRIRDT